MLRIYSAIHLQHWSPAERESKAHQAEPSVRKTCEGDFKMKTPFPSECLRESQCKALRGRLQCFAWAIAKLCVDGCKALRGRMQCFASEMGKTGTEIVSPILDKRKGRVDSPYGALLPPPKVISVGPVSAQNKTSLHAGRTKKRCLAVTRHL